MQGGNVIVMPNRSPSHDPENVSFVWKAVHKIEKDVEDLTKKVNAPTLSMWKNVWAERAWVIPT